MSEYLNKKAVLDDLHTEKNHLVYRRDKSDYHPEKTYCSWRIEQIDITIEKILSGAFDANGEDQRLRAALEEVHEELKTLHFMIDHDDDIFHERKKKYLSIIDYVGQSVAGQALSTTTEPTNAAKVKRMREGDGNDA